MIIIQKDQIMFHVSCLQGHVSCFMYRVSPFTCHMALTPVATVTELPLANSPTVHIRMVCKVKKKIEKQFQSKNCKF